MHTLWSDRAVLHLSGYWQVNRQGAKIDSHLMVDPGYHIKEDVFASMECDALAAQIQSSVSSRGRAGARHLMAIPGIAVLAADPRLVELASEFLGDRPIPYRATLFEKSGKANWLVVWHQDTALALASHTESSEWGPWSTKGGVLYAHAPAWALERIVALRIHLDASTLDNGPLRVIPGSHRYGVLTDEEIFSIGRSQDATDCLVGRGGVVAMRPLLIHSSRKVESDLPRRVLHIEYADTLEIGQGVRLAVA